MSEVLVQGIMQNLDRGLTLKIIFGHFRLMVIPLKD
jgi:hypothetical protein